MVPTAQTSTVAAGVTATSPAAATAATAATLAGPTATSAPTASATPAATSFTVGYVAGTGAAAGVLEAVQATAKTLGWTEQTAPNSGADGLTSLAQAGAQVIIADGADLEAATRAAAGAFPKA